MKKEEEKKWSLSDSLSEADLWTCQLISPLDYHL